MVRMASAVLITANVAACGGLGPENGPLADLERNERLWERERPASYVYAIERICFCGAEALGPVRVTVQGESVTERVYVDSGLAVSAPWAEHFPAVGGLFDLVRAAIESGAHRVDVTYDPLLGVPVDFFIDYLENAVDEELGVRVTEPVAPG